MSAGADAFARVHRAWLDLREFHEQLTALHAATRTASSPDNRARVTVRGGEIVGIELDPYWRGSVRDEDLEGHLADGLRAALTLITITPQQALDGCPDLLQVLAAGPAVLPFPLPEPAAAPAAAAPSGGADPDRPRWTPPADWNRGTGAPASRFPTAPPQSSTPRSGPRPSSPASDQCRSPLHLFRPWREQGRARTSFALAR